MLYDPATPIHTEDFTLAMQIRCGHFGRRFKKCTCGYEFQKDGYENLSHLLTCDRNYYSYTRRHEEIVHDLNKILKKFSFNTQHEPRQFMGKDNTRPDLVIFTSRVSPVIDVTVITNTALTYRNKSDPTEAEAQAKCTKHEANVAKQGAYVFYPVVLETSGNIHNAFDNLLTALSQELPQHQRKEFRREMCFAASTALQRGSARILKHAYGRLENANTFGTRAYF